MSGAEIDWLGVAWLGFELLTAAGFIAIVLWALLDWQRKTQE